MTIEQTILSDITTYMKYAKFVPALNRRETWGELVTRNKEMHLTKFPGLKIEIDEAYEFVYQKKVLPSMRSMQFAGRPIELNNARLFNCAYLPIDDYSAFSEIMFLLLSGCGVGYSIQKHHIEKLPEIRKPLKRKRYLIGDSIEGWADAVKMLCKAYFGKSNYIPIFDYGDIRIKGSQLITAGGKAPGPDPLRIAINYVQAIFESKKDGEKLESYECHDIICFLADAVLSGGIRRAALIALFSWGDDDMLLCKSNYQVQHFRDLDQLSWGGIEIEADVIEPGYGPKVHRLTLTKEEHEELLKTHKLAWWNFQPQRGRSNNSVVFLRNKIDRNVFLDLWKKIELSNSGEPGFLFSNDKDAGTNPCAEINLRACQFCNLTTINASNIESQDDFNARAKAAAFIGTLQASYTNFHYLRDVWKKTTEKEALLGVSMTGVAAGEVFKYSLREAAKIVVDTNKCYAPIIGVNIAARSTTLKPEGTTSLVVGTSSGAHDWHDEYYLRSIRIGKQEALYTHLSIYNAEILEDEYFNPKQTAVIRIPQKAPKGALLRTKQTALDLLERVKLLNKEWIEPGHRKGTNMHNVSATINIKPNEWEKIGSWLFENKNYFTALSFMPEDLGTYIQAPFETITEKEYYEKVKSLQSINLANVYEMTDETNLMEQLACAGGSSCEIK